jgi:hypothetical protein
MSDFSTDIRGGRIFETLTSILSLASRASCSLRKRSLISLSLITQAAALVAAASG